MLFLADQNRLDRCQFFSLKWLRIDWPTSRGQEPSEELSVILEVPRDRTGDVATRNNTRYLL